MAPETDIMTAEEDFQKKVIAQFEAVRRSALTNMFGRDQVQVIANDQEFFELVNAITDGMYGSILRNYSELISMVSPEEIPEIDTPDDEWGEESKKEVEKAVDKLLSDEARN